MPKSQLLIVRLQVGRHKRAMGGHPWIYSNEVLIEPPTKLIEPGSIVEFRTHDRQLIGKGTFNLHTLIAGRIITRKPEEQINQFFLKKRLEEALALRSILVPEPFYRLIHAEADGLPGLIIDRFGKHLSVQLNTAGMDKLWPELEAALIEVLKPDSIILRNESSMRELEGLKKETKVVSGPASGTSSLIENGLTFFADLHTGQKTGWYFDQRNNHATVGAYAAKAETVLDLYTHAGGFALHALKAGAKSVIGVDSSEAALELAKKSAEKNKLQAKCTWVKADVFEDLERRVVAGEKFDVVIADPPAFVKSRKALVTGARGYRKLAKMAASVTAPKGILFIASCSYNMDLVNFTEQVARGLHEAGRSGRILETLFAAPDHPVHPHVPESSYLKGLLVQLD